MAHFFAELQLCLRVGKFLLTLVELLVLLSIIIFLSTLEGVYKLDMKVYLKLICSKSKEFTMLRN